MEDVSHATVVMAVREREEDGSREKEIEYDSFQWDEESRLYFHARSGFYHDPTAGWYYNSRDGLYYTFENGNYVLFKPEECNGEDSHLSTVQIAEPVQDFENISSDGAEECTPPSDWLESTLINMYLSGYSECTPCDDGSVVPHLAEMTNKVDSEKSMENLCLEEIEEGEWIPEVIENFRRPDGDFNEDDSTDIENWRSQYGQVVELVDPNAPSVSAVDLWDWSLITRTTQKKRSRVTKLVGKLNKPSARLHPSMPVGGVLFKTASICEVHLDLVRVSSGQIYRLRSPSANYLSSLSAYDSSNPTGDWGFPDLFMTASGSFCKEVFPHENSSVSCQELLSTTQKDCGIVYRDRAAERRILHGGFGIGPGQNPSEAYCTSDVDSSKNSPFEAGSYARRILENMGWREGESLGRTSKGLLEPLQAIGNIGNAGLGWCHGRSVHRKYDS